MEAKKYLFGAILVVSIFLSSCNNSPKANKAIKLSPQIEKGTVIKKEAKLKSSEVCFVNNQYMGIEQIPVIVDDKTYYGCCEGCVLKLKNNLDGVQFSVDPLTGESVDKATAYIVLKATGGVAVQYFASEKNYLTFAKL